MPVWVLPVLIGLVLAVAGFGGAGEVLVWLGALFVAWGLVVAVVSTARSRQ